MSYSSIHRILVAVKDPAAATPAPVLKAAELARALNAELVLFHAIDLPLYADAYASGERDIGDDENSVRAQFLHNLTAQAAPLRTEGLSISVAAEWDHPAYEAVLRHAQRIEADLIVSEHHPQPSSARWGLHPTDWELLRLSSKPVLLVKDSAAYRQPSILAALDPLHKHAKPADLDVDICQLAGTVSTALGGAWHALHAYRAVTERLLPGKVTPAGAASRLTERRRSRALAAVDRVLNSASLIPQSVQLLDLRPTDAILESARTLHADIVVMGAMSRSGLKQLLIGNTAEQVIDTLSCDILVVKPKRFGIRFPRRVRGTHLLNLDATVPR